MSPTSAARPRRYPLHVHLAVLFSALVLLACAVLTWLAYAQGRALALAAADETFANVEREIQASMRAVLAPVGSLADLLAQHPLAHARTLEERLAALPTLALMLDGEAPVDAAYLGYDDGSFFLVRRLAHAADRKRFGAPDGAALLVEHRGPVAAGRTATLVFCDDLLRELGRAPGRGDYDPRTRPWFQLASVPGRRVLTAPYVFFSTRTPGMTVAVRTNAGSVVGLDVALAQVASTLAAVRTIPRMEVALFDESGRVLATADQRREVVRTENDALTLATRESLGVPVLALLPPANPADTGGRFSTVQAGGEQWKGAVVPIATARGPLSLAIAAPLDELLAGARAIRDRSMIAALAVLVFAIPLTWWVAQRAAGTLKRLTAEAHDIEAFRFDGAGAGPSPILEIDQLAAAMERMRGTIRHFLDIATSLGGETNFDRLRRRIVHETASAAGADAGLIYLLADDGRTLAPGPLLHADGTAAAAAVAPQTVDAASPIAEACRTGRTTVAAAGTDALAAAHLPALWPGARATLVAIPLRTRDGEPLGVLALLGRGEAPPGDAQLAFARTLSGTAAVAIETQRLLEERKALLDAFIRLLAGAIDAKSPYTGGHCQRVPELTLMLARAACDATEGPLADFALSEEDWEALQIASWLHDCGKVTTPEYVVDKATKLETLYDRIHEVRMRFEVLKRDAEIAFWRGVAEGGDRAPLKTAFEAATAQLDDDWRFVAGCNEGGEFMDPAKVDRLRAIARRTWLRTLDDRIGIAHEERLRKEATPAPPLPAAEPLLADKPEHVIERRPDDRVPGAMGFAMKVPPLKYNRGELYNLSVGRGTLTEEERYVINHHIVQTIVMLSQLPFPRHLKQVPEIAGGHHEKMDGTGYPRRLKRDDMSWAARMMAIADIFEALTAVDRPYKRGKTLSEALKIMSAMRREAHIDPDLFALFLRSGVYRAYAEKHLRPEQIDAVDVERYLAAA